MLAVRHIKRVVLILAIALAIGAAGFGLGRWYFFLTDGFGPSAIVSDFPYDPAWEVGPLSAEQQKEIWSVLDQKYSYMAKGCECYVLESKDGKYVMKFFKQKHLYLPWWQRFFAHFPFVGSIAQNAMQRREEKRLRIYSGCKFAYDDCQQETGMVYIHLNPSNELPRRVMIFDKLGYRHFIDLNTVPFYIQRKGVPIDAMLLAFKHTKDVQGATAALEELFAYLERRSAKGIVDPDPNLLANLGFLDGHAITLDVGYLTQDPHPNPLEYRPRILEAAHVIRHWIEGYFPELLANYDRIVQAFQQQT